MGLTDMLGIGPPGEWMEVMMMFLLQKRERGEGGDRGMKARYAEKDLNETPDIGRNGYRMTRQRFADPFEGWNGILLLRNTRVGCDEADL